MKRFEELHSGFVTFVVGALCLTATASAAAETSTPAAAVDGQRDFDWEIGAWKTHLRRLLHPLSGSTDWVEYDGETIVRRVWNGRANLVELDVTGPAGRIEALSLRLYHPDSRTWSLNFANSASGEMTTPMIGEFRDGRGEFRDKETLDGRPIDARFVIWCDAPDVCQFEQSFSDDGGDTWEVNWIATDTRVKTGISR